MVKIFEGVATAIVTPFNNGMVDFDALSGLIEHQISSNIPALVVLGTTGESATLSACEQEQIITFAKEKIRGRTKLIVGTGTNYTKTTIVRSLHAKQLGADAIMVVTPYYNKCTQQGATKHFNKIANTTRLPMIIYNVPGRTGFNLTPNTVLELAKNPYIVGIKEASGNIDQMMQLCKLLDGKLAIYCGDDVLDFLCYALGSDGSISVTANVFPDKKVELYNLVKAGKLDQARKAHNDMLDINTALFIEPNPIPVKAALCHLGFCRDEVRPPLTKIEPRNKKKLLGVLK